MRHEYLSSVLKKTFRNNHINKHKTCSLLKKAFYFKGVRSMLFTSTCPELNAFLCSTNSSASKRCKIKRLTQYVLWRIKIAVYVEIHVKHVTLIAYHVGWSSNHCIVKSEGTLSRKRIINYNQRCSRMTSWRTTH